MLHRDPPGAKHSPGHSHILSRCSLTSEQVRRHYMSGGPEAHESTGIIFVEKQVRGGKVCHLDKQLGWGLQRGKLRLGLFLTQVTCPVSLIHLGLSQWPPLSHGNSRCQRNPRIKSFIVFRAVVIGLGTPGDSGGTSLDPVVEEDGTFG